jgi:hypothetical protein
MLLMASITHQFKFQLGYESKTLHVVIEGSGHDDVSALDDAIVKLGEHQIDDEPEGDVEILLVSPWSEYIKY